MMRSKYLNEECSYDQDARYVSRGEKCSEVKQSTLFTSWHVKHWPLGGKTQITTCLRVHTSYSKYSEDERRNFITNDVVTG